MRKAGTADRVSGSLRVAFALAEFPHYRGGVLRALDDDHRFSSTFLGDQTPRAPLEIMDTTDLRDVRLVTNRRFRPTYYWQQSMLTHLIWKKYDVVVFLGDTHVLSTWFLAPLSRLMGRKVLFWTIGWHRPERLPVRWLKNAFYRCADLVLLYGRMGREFGAASGFPVEKTRIIGNSIELRIDPVGPSQTQGDAIICVGRLTPAKSLDFLLTTLAAQPDLRSLP